MQAARVRRTLLVLLIASSMVTSAAMLGLVVGRISYDADARYENDVKSPWLESAGLIDGDTTWIAYRDSPEDPHQSYQQLYFAFLDERGRFIHDGITMPETDYPLWDPVPDVVGEFLLQDRLCVLAMDEAGRGDRRTGTVYINVTTGEVVGPLWELEWPFDGHVETTMVVSGSTVHLLAQNDSDPGSTGPGRGLYYTTSEGPTINWSAPVDVLSHDIHPDQVSIAANLDGVVAVTVSAYNYSSDIPTHMDMLLRSHDGGLSWGEPMNITGDPLPGWRDCSSFLTILQDGTLLLGMDNDLSTVTPPEFFRITPTGERTRITPPHGDDYVGVKIWMEPKTDDLLKEVRVLLADWNGSLGYELKIGSTDFCETIFQVSPLVWTGIWIAEMDGRLRSVSVQGEDSPREVRPVWGELVLLETERSTGEENIIGKPYIVVRGHTESEEVDYKARTDRWVGYTWCFVGILLAAIVASTTTSRVHAIGQGRFDHKAKSRVAGLMGAVVLAMFTITSLLASEQDNRRYFSFWACYMALGVLLVEMLSMLSPARPRVRLFHLILVPYLMTSVAGLALAGVSEGGNPVDFLFIPLTTCLYLPFMLGMTLFLMAIDLMLMKAVYGLGETQHPLRSSRTFRLLPVVSFAFIALMPIVLSSSMHIVY